MMFGFAESEHPRLTTGRGIRDATVTSFNVNGRDVA